ncbi:MAG: T9SS type A sorting domain-containing protein [Bacteroidetes bacterium]|nr:T9SS type A sorting domain-containing protein [Bacteroidota bacterium]MBL6944237.1 T9SS type A sorting domain-containing protein [Bacteroidales bacterium]
MKRKKLPLGLALISIVLGGIFVGFSNNFSESKYFPRLTPGESLVNGIEPSVEYLALIRNNQTTGVIAPEYLNRVQNQLKDFDNSRSFVDLSWRQLGPDNFGGRTRAIMFDNQDAEAKTLYAAGVSGGIWKSDNLGISWQKINSESYNLNVSCMKQDASGTIYAGTGESFGAQTFSGLSEMGYTGGFMGQGIFKSTDGDNFSVIASTVPEFNNDNSDWAFVNELAVDLNNGRLYAATNFGLKYSNDGGVSWAVAKDTAGTELNMNSVDVQVASDGAVVACIDNFCYISPSGAVDAFVPRSTGDSISLPSSNVSRIEFAFAPSDPNVLYASVVKNNGNVYNMYRSDNKGLTWRIILPGTNAVPIFNISTSNGMGVYDNALTVYPEDPDKILLGGINAWEGRKILETGLFSWVNISSQFYLPVYHHTYVFRPGSNNTFFVGTDGGVAIGTVSGGNYVFEESNRSYFTTQFYNIGPSGLENYVVGGAQGNGTILITGNGNTTKQGRQIGGGNGGACVVSLINKDVLVASASGANMARSEDAGVNYSTQFVGGLDLDTDFFNTPMALWENFNNPNSRDSLWYHAKVEIPGGTKIKVRSNNSGQPFYYTTPIDVIMQPGDSILVQDVVSSRYFIASSDIVYMTNELHLFNKTPEWFEISNNSVGFVGSSQCISYSSDANHIFVGTREGKLFRISNLALAYNYDRADVNSTECIVSTQEIPIYIPGTTDPISQVITSIAIDPDNPANVMITLGNYGNDYYVLYSDNALDEVPVFNSRQGNLPQMPVYSSVIEMSDTDIGIVGTENGIFVTENIRAESPVWMQQDSLMGSVQVFQLQQQMVSKTPDEVILINGNDTIIISYPGTDNYGVIYAATFGRGLFRCNIFERPVGLEEIYDDQYSEVMELKIYPNPVIDFATIKLEAFSNSNADIFVYDLAGRRALYVTHVVKKGINNINLDLSGLKSGTYVIQVVIGSNIYSQKFIAN